MKTWDELSSAERMSPRKRWDMLAEELNKSSTGSDTSNNSKESNSDG